MFQNVKRRIKYLLDLAFTARRINMQCVVKREQDQGFWECCYGGRNHIFYNGGMLIMTCTADGTARWCDNLPMSP